MLKKNYPNPPITEAVIDIQVEPADKVSLAELHLVTDPAYPKRRNRFLYQGELTAGASVSASATQQQIGFISFSDDEKQSFQARLDGFTFSRLAPYKDWKTIRDEAERLWSIYRQNFNIRVIRRIAVRYINRLDLPLPFQDFKDYLQTTPELGTNMSQGLSGFFMRLESPQDDIDAMLVLHEAMIPPPSPEFVSVLLDIDLFRECKLPFNEDQLWQVLEILATRKNIVFEASITDKTRDLFN